jgi:acetylornithine/succinyldiaminopimelate/putrescine aminotransferase
MGRTGWPLACDREGVRPDLVTVSKGLGGGFPVGALLLGRELAATVKPSEHGTTFGGGPLACAAVEATIDIFLTEGLLERAKRFGEIVAERFRGVPGVVEVRAAGAWAGIVLDREARPVADALLARGYIIGTATDPRVLRMAPPSIMPFAAIDGLAVALREVLA